MTIRPPRRGCNRAALAALVWCLGTQAATADCGELLTVTTHAGTTSRLSLAMPEPPTDPRATLILLPGGGGFADLDDAGCARALKGNSLIRAIPHFRRAGLATVLVDAPSDHHGDDGLGGFRTTAEHAADLGRIIALARERLAAPVWLVGTSRGSISAANAASRLPDGAGAAGVVVSSALMAGQYGARKAWVADSVFDLPLEALRLPILILGHARDSCVRSPPSLMERFMARVGSTRKKAVLMDGGPDPSGFSAALACEGRSPHGFFGQDEEMARVMTDFILGQSARE